MKQPYVVPSTRRRDLLIGLGIGVVLVAMLWWVVINLGSGVAGVTLEGTVVEKHFTPRQEEQVTFGKRGVESRKIDGEYVLECDVKGKRYLVTVEKKVYQSRKIGDSLHFARPIEE